MKRIVWLELGSYISKAETQHYLLILGVVGLKGAWRSGAKWTSLHLALDRAQLSKLELQVALDPLVVFE